VQRIEENNRMGKTRDHFVFFEIAPKYCILDSFVGYEGYSTSSKGEEVIFHYYHLIIISFL